MMLRYSINSDAPFRTLEFNAKIAGRFELKHHASSPFLKTRVTSSVRHDHYTMHTKSLL